MEPLNLKSVLSMFDIRLEKDIYVNHVCTDTRNIVPGCLFIPIEGQNFDGHDYIDEAFKLGAVASISHKDVKFDNHMIFRLNDTREAYLKIAGYYRDTVGVPVIGVTGSCGKTTTKDMIYSVLNNVFHTLKTQGNLNNEIGVPFTLFRLDKTYRYSVIEMGMSDFSEISRLSRTSKPNISVITNIGYSHVENLKSKDNVLKAKLEILDGMSKGSPIVLNGDDKLLFGCKDKLDNPVVYYGIENKLCDIIADNILEQELSTSFFIYYNGNKYNAQIPCLGKHNVLNALAAFSVGILVDMSPADILEGLKKYESSELRQEIDKINGLTVIKDCYNANPDSMRAALNVLSSFNVGGKKIAVLGDMFELGDFSDELHFKIGEYLSHLNIDFLFCCGTKSYQIILGAKSKGYKNFFYSENKDSLFERLKSVIGAGDVILFKASRAMKFECIIKQIFEECSLK